MTPILLSYADFWVLNQYEHNYLHTKLKFLGLVRNSSSSALHQLRALSWVERWCSTKPAPRSYIGLQCKPKKLEKLVIRSFTRSSKTRSWCKLQATATYKWKINGSLDSKKIMGALHALFCTSHHTHTRANLWGLPSPPCQSPADPPPPPLESSHDPASSLSSWAPLRRA
jgi:hypothetical protein